MSFSDSVKDLFLSLGVLALGLGSYYFLLWLSDYLLEVCHG